MQILLAKLAPKFHLLVLWLLHVNMSFIYGAYVPIVMDVIMFNDLFKFLCAHVYVTQVRTHLMAKFKFQNHQQQLQSTVAESSRPAALQPAAGTLQPRAAGSSKKWASRTQPQKSGIVYSGLHLRE